MWAFLYCQGLETAVSEVSQLSGIMTQGLTAQLSTTIRSSGPDMVHNMIKYTYQSPEAGGRCLGVSGESIGCRNLHAP